MTRNKKIILGSIIGIPLFLGILGASNPSSNIKSTANSQTQQTTITPLLVTKTPVIKLTAVPTVTPKPTIKPTITPFPTIYIAPTIKYVASTTPPASTESSNGLSNNNYYTNTGGNEVHSPAASTDGSVPAGATAKCGDGTYSFSQSHRGTCSSHGGVAEWL